MITSQAFEVEELEPRGDDVILDIKVLPDRSGDAKTEVGMARELATLTGLALKSEFLAPVDERTIIPFSAPEINKILGLNLSATEIVDYLARVRVRVEGETTHIPADRLDLNLIEELADEVGRLYGVDRIPATPLPAWAGKGETDPLVTVADFVRGKLAQAGYTEIFGYSFTDHGERQIEKPLASDKGYLRTNLTEGLSTKIADNLAQTLFDTDAVKLFEIGTVFFAESETVRVAVGLGYRQPKFQKEKLPDFVTAWGGTATNKDGISILECDLESISADTPIDLSAFIKPAVVYQPFSLYPRIIRDVALWVPAKTAEDEVKKVITESAGDLLVEGPALFDRFVKDGRVSLAFRQVFQSYAKTLSDLEVNQMISKVILALEQRGWEVRK